MIGDPNTTEVAGVNLHLKMSIELNLNDFLLVMLRLNLVKISSCE